MVGAGSDLTLYDAKKIAKQVVINKSLFGITIIFGEISGKRKKGGTKSSG